MILNEVYKMDLSKNNAPKEPKVYTEDKTMQEIFLKTTGRLNRLRYFQRVMAVTLATVAIDFPFFMIFSDEWGYLTSFGDMITTIISIVALFPMYCLDVRRLQDMDKDNTIAKISFVISVIIMFIAPDDIFTMDTSVAIVYLVNGAIGLYLLFTPGTKGENKYGPDPLG